MKALRHEFTVSTPIKSARLYATALGAYEIFLNGKRVGDQVLSPGWTDYRERVDLPDLRRDRSSSSQGENAIGALLAPGWYETPLEWFQQPNNYGVTPPALRAQLRIEHTDGSVEWVTTDASWQATPSYILHSEIYDGESAGCAPVASRLERQSLSSRRLERSRRSSIPHRSRSKRRTSSPSASSAP